jgi:hypothetical protein
MHDKSIQNPFIHFSNDSFTRSINDKVSPFFQIIWELMKIETTVSHQVFFFSSTILTYERHLKNKIKKCNSKKQFSTQIFVLKFHGIFAEYRERESWNLSISKEKWLCHQLKSSTFTKIFLTHRFSVLLGSTTGKNGEEILLLNEWVSEWVRVRQGKIEN